MNNYSGGLRKVLKIYGLDSDSLKSKWGRVFSKLKSVYTIIVLLLFVFFIPFIGIAINDAWGWNIGNLYLFRLDSVKDFFTLWIALFGAIGIAVNIIYTQTRINQQSKQQMDNRFASGIELLGHSSESSRMGAAYNLFLLAKEYPKEYKESVSNILCAHIRTTTNVAQYYSIHSGSPSNEIQFILDLLFKKNVFRGYKADLTGSWLKGADFKRADLRGVLMKSVHLETADFEGANLSSAVLDRAMIMDASFKNVLLREAVIESCDFSRSMLNSEFSHISFKNCIFYEATILGGVFATAFCDCEFRATDFSNVRIHTCSFEEVTFRNSNFKGARIEFSSFKKCYLINIDLTTSTLYSVSFPDTDLESTKLPKAFTHLMKIGQDI